MSQQCPCQPPPIGHSPSKRSRRPVWVTTAPRQRQCTCVPSPWAQSQRSRPTGLHKPNLSLSHPPRHKAAAAATASAGRAHRTACRKTRSSRGPSRRPSRRQRRRLGRRRTQPRRARAGCAAKLTHCGTLASAQPAAAAARIHTSACPAALSKSPHARQGPRQTRIAAAPPASRINISGGGSSSGGSSQ
jgi:hypothetical protein